MKVSVERLAVRSDPRGYVFEPARTADLAGQGNVHVVISEPGAVRGNHVHRRGSEILVVVGPALIRVREDGVVRDIDVAEGEVIRCDIPPLVPHAVRNTGSKPGLLVGFNTVAHDPAAPDVYPEELIRP